LKALVFHQFGRPEVLLYEDVPNPLPHAGHAIVRFEAIGLNFADVYRRRGKYHLLGEPPYIARYEGAGVIKSLEMGSDGTEPEWRLGDRVGFADVPFANAELVSAPLEKLIRLPDDIASDLAAALLLQGMTAQYLTRDSHPLRAGETVLLHAAAGGVGLLLVQIAKRHGAPVMALTSSPHKAEAAQKTGPDWLGWCRDRSLIFKPLCDPV
jgi:NADPH:quinone reductase